MAKMKFSVVSFSSFIISNGFIAAACGHVIGKVFAEVVTSIVQDVCMPASFALLNSMGLGTRARELYRNLKTVVDPMSLLKNVIVFLCSLLIVYAGSKFVYSHVVRDPPGPRG
jgi:large-conductance mechanosensitive channel